MLSIYCPKCGAAPLEKCHGTTPGGNELRYFYEVYAFHVERRRQVRRNQSHLELSTGRF